MRTARLVLFGLVLGLLTACGTTSPTEPGPSSETARDCGYLGSSGCP